MSNDQNNVQPSKTDKMLETDRQERAAMRAQGLRMGIGDEAPKLSLANKIPLETDKAYVKRVERDRLSKRFIAED